MYQFEVVLLIAQFDELPLVRTLRGGMAMFAVLFAAVFPLGRWPRGRLFSQPVERGRTMTPATTIQDRLFIISLLLNEWGSINTTHFFDPGGPPR